MLATRRGDEFARQLSHVSFKAPAIALFSTRSLKTVTADDLSDPSSWSYDASGGGQFDATIESLAGEGYRIFVDAGPAFVLSDRLQELLVPHAGACLPSLRRGRNDWEQMLETLAALYERGVNVDWDSLYRYDTARKVVLPTYPFSPRKYWLEPAKTPDKAQSADAARALGCCRCRGRTAVSPGPDGSRAAYLRSQMAEPRPTHDCVYDADPATVGRLRDCAGASHRRYFDGSLRQFYRPIKF